MVRQLILAKLAEMSLGELAGPGALVLGSYMVSSSINNVGQSINNVGQSINNVGQSINNVGQSINNVGQSINNVGRSINDVGRSINNLGRGGGRERGPPLTMVMQRSVHTAEHITVKNEGM